MMTSSPSACIELKPGTHFAKVVLMPGDPLRAKYIAETYLEEPELFNTVRNMYGYTGTYKGKKISVMGSGMGIPSATLYAHELYAFFDVDAIIRVGTSGSLQDDIHVRDVVIASTASTNSAYASQYGWTGTLAPAADSGMLFDAVDICRAKGSHVKVGSVFTTDVFYNADSGVPARARDLGMMCVEMETAGLYLEAMHMHKKALSILSISDHMFTGEELTALEREQSFNEMMEISLETAWKCID